MNATGPVTSSFLHEHDAGSVTASRAAIASHWFADEDTTVTRLCTLAELAPDTSAALLQQAASWVTRVRQLRDQQSPLDSFMQEYDLGSEEGVLLMCLAEALQRIPDDETAERLIADKLSDADWESHLGRSDSLFVNASTWGLMLTGRMVRLSPGTTSNVRGALSRLVGRSSEPVIRMAIRQAMKLMGHQFVLGRTIGEAIRNTGSRSQRHYLHSFDMLGEAALTADDAQRYFRAYYDAIAAIGATPSVDPAADVQLRPGISVKLSALHPRYEASQRDRVRHELVPRLLSLAQHAKAMNIGFTVDAEEADRLELSLDIVEAVFADRSLEGWNGFGLAVQAYQKRALPVLDWLHELAGRVGRRLAVRLVKGAYWDTEIKRCQEQGLPGYPVFTRKVNTDVSYLACARRLLDARDCFFPMLATHNAQTVAAVRAYAGNDQGYEFQRLHGMGESLYDVVREDLPVRCRVYAPVGSHQDLLPYLVRRLLENGANTSFVNRIFDEQVPAEQLVEDPIAEVRRLDAIPNPEIALPSALYGAERLNSAGINLADEQVTRTLGGRLAQVAPITQARSRVAATLSPGTDGHEIRAPADHRRVLGDWAPLALDGCRPVVEAAVYAQRAWSRRSVGERADLLDAAALRYESASTELLRLLIDEAGKTIPDAVAEVREAIDFLRYYAAQARRLMGAAVTMPGPTGEHNELQLHGKGVFVCIAPWNFPLAIFTGQIAAALVTGNTVVAKPAEQTNLIGTRATDLLHEAGIPRDVLQCVLGDGTVGAALVDQPGIAGVAFTGSVEVAQSINRSLAARPGPIASLIAETGGQNAMLVDSSALPEQVVKDAMHSAFLSAGQRCSALRVLCLQNDIADRTLRLLTGAMHSLVIGDPRWLSTDIGPVIDDTSRRRLETHAAAISRSGQPVAHLDLPHATSHGTYFAPCAVEISGIDALDGETFGPMLHVVRFPARGIESVLEAINGTGYGLTLGVHSRIESTWRLVQRTARVGNLYVNRGMTGAVVGTQPFGGEGLSGTGPKAGGPHYLLRFVHERTLTVNTAAVGGNARLLAASG